MSARKVVISRGLIVLMSLHSGSTPAKETGGGKTVGDLLKRIEANTKKVQFSKTKSSLPQVSKIQKDPPARENLAKIKPPARSTLYYDEGTNEAELEEITEKGIRQLYKLTQQFKTSKRRGELWLRLAELYVEKARLIEYQLQQKFDEKLRNYKVSQGPKPVFDLSPAQEYNRKAIQLYDWFVRDFPQDPKIDQALFFLGYNYFELNQAERGKTFYERLTKEFPRSSYIEESNFALAEYYFDREKWADALQYYAKVAANKRARLYSFALYKMAWCQYKTGEVKKALVSLENVVRAGRSGRGAKDGSVTGAGRIRLASEAQKDMVVFYAEAVNYKDARNYFSDIVEEKYTFGLLEKLAYYYADIGNREGARYVFRQLIDERPNSPKAYDYQYQIVTMYVSSDKGDVFKAELYNWIQSYSPNSEWARANNKDKELIAKANQLIETTLRNHILQQHQTAQNSRVPEAQKVAKAGYELYFQTFKESAHLDEMHFFYGELLFDLGAFELAAYHYNWVAENGTKSKYFEKATLNAVLAVEKALPKEEDLKKQVGENLEAVPLGKNVSDFEVAVNRYVKIFPKGENVPAIRYKMGALYYYHNQFDKALESFNAIIKEYPKSPYAQYSANLTLDIYNLKKDYGGLEKAGQDILNNEDLAKSQVGAQVKGVLQRANFKRAQDLEAKKDYAGAAQAYEEFARKNPSSELGSSASFNAAVNFEKAGDSTKAIGMYGLVLADHNPKNERLRSSSSRFVASLYEKTGQYKRAADSFEAYANKNQKDKEAIIYFYNAAVIRDGLNQYAAALANYQKYFDLSRSADRWESVLLMAKLWNRRGNITKAADYYKQYYDARPRNASGLIEAAFMLAKFHARKNHRTEADDWYKKTIYQQKTLSNAENPIGVSFAAEAKYILVAKTYDELRFIRIPANPAKQGEAVKQKLAMLERLKNQLKDVIRYDDAHMVVNSLTLIGQAYQHMASSISAVPLPGGLDGEGMKTYKAGVEKVVQPFLSEAIKNYETAIERGYKLEGYGDGLKIAQKELNRLSKGKYPNFGEKIIVTKMLDTMGLDSNEELASSWKAKDEQMMVDAVAKILGKDQNDLKALNGLALFYIDQGKLGMARILLARAEKAHPEEPAIHNNLGVISLDEAKQRPAITSFRKALDQKRGYAIGAANLGSIFVEYRDYTKAVDLLSDGYGSVKSDLRRGVGLNVANNYAVALSGTNENEKARSIFQDVLKAESQNTTALLNYTILLVHRLNDKKEGGKMLSKLKFLADDDATRQRIQDLDRILNEN